jgi:hypothetical protein
MGKFLHWYQVNFIRLYQGEKEREREKRGEGRREQRNGKAHHHLLKLIMQL